VRNAACGFPPVIDARVETLILGSFPGVVSLEKCQYYGHPQNHFWRLVGTVIGEPLPDLEYVERLHVLLAHRIGLWDIIDECVRPGSLDSSIRKARHNDFERVTKVAKNLGRVCFNGKTSGKMAPLFAEWGYETVALPSSSPAYTLPFKDKLKQWRKIAAPRITRGRRSTAMPRSGVLPLTSLQKC
jgi:double-stranded uracil-DNA glycosylase